MKGESQEMLIQNVDYLIRDADRIELGVDLLIEGNRIREISKSSGVQVRSSMEIIDGTGMIAMPGFVNTHTHCYQSLLKGVRDDLGLKQWCEQVTFPFASIIHKEERETDHPRLGYLWSMLGAMEMVRSGITAFVDMDMNQEGVLQAWDDLGVRGTLGLQLVNRWVPPELMIPDELRKKRALKLIEKWHGQGLLQVAMAPSTAFACTPEFLTWIRQTAERLDLSIHIHVNETRWELEQARAETGMTPIGYLESLGFFNRPVNAVHCVHVTDHDVEILKNRSLRVIYNPKSNAKLGSGIAPVPRFLEMGIPVAIATDGSASNDTNDMFEEMRFGQLIQKAYREDPRALSVKDVYRMATEEGARTVNLEMGRLDEGSLADVVLVRRKTSHMEPIHDLLQTVFYCSKAPDVDTVIIDGKIVLKNGEMLTVSEGEIIEEAIEKMKTIGYELEGELSASF